MYTETECTWGGRTPLPPSIGSVAANFEIMASSLLAASKILNMAIFEVTWVYSNLRGHFVGGSIIV